MSNAQEDLRVSFLHYIMGRLPESDRTRFEEQLLQDQDLSDAAAACEQELIDAYALHRLDAEETRAVGLWIEASPDRVERVAIARALLQTAPQRGIRRQRIGITLTIAACLFAATTLYLVNTKMLHRGQRNIQVPAAIPAPQGNSALSAEATSGETPKPDVVLIAAERVRGEQKATIYQVHRESPIQLQVLLPGETARSGYRIQVSAVEDQSKVLLQQDDLETKSIASQLYLTVTLPAGSLPPATYTASITRQGETLVSTFTLKWAQ